MGHTSNKVDVVVHGYCISIIFSENPIVNSRGGGVGFSFFLLSCFIYSVFLIE